MANNAYDVNYDDLTSSTQTLNKTSEEMNRILEKASQIMNETCGGEIFKGPAADYSLNTWNQVSNITQKTNNSYVATGNSLNNINEYYQQTDEEVGEKAGDI